jgi:Predicted ring-cleavage extradiol dioxygenase
MDTALGHVHLLVSDLDRSISFYTDLVDLSVTERQPNYAFLSFGDQHHDLALQAQPDASSPSPDSPGLYHVAFEVDTAASLRECYAWLQDEAISVRSVDHGISKSLYFVDPDDNDVELYLDTRASETELWGRENSTFDPTTL